MPASDCDDDPVPPAPVAAPAAGKGRPCRRRHAWTCAAPQVRILWHTCAGLPRGDVLEERIRLGQGVTACPANENPKSRVFPEVNRKTIYLDLLPATLGWLEPGRVANTIFSFFFFFFSPLHFSFCARRRLKGSGEPYGRLCVAAFVRNARSLQQDTKDLKALLGARLQFSLRREERTG